MFRSNRRDNKQLSRDLRNLVHQNLGKEIERVARQRADRSTDQREISILCENVGKRMDQFQMQDEHCRKERSAVLDSRQSQMLAAKLLERLQAQTTASFEEPVLDEQGDRLCHRDEAHFGPRD